MVRRAKISEIDDIMEITRACARRMISLGIYQWNEQYPAREAFLNDLERDELYVNEKEGKVAGAIVISTYMDDEYIPISWLTPNEKNVYIHRVCVHPDFQGKGLAQEMMGFAETQSKNQGFASVRLDTFSQNERNQRFYEKRGYQKLGDIFFPKQSEHPFHCYELVL